MNVDKWIEALQHPLVLAGFGLFLFAALIKPLFLNNKKLSGTAMERLLHKGMNFAFALALLAIAGGLLLTWKSNAAGGGRNETVGIPQQNLGKVHSSVSAIPAENAANNVKGAAVSITASGHGQISIGGDVINSEGNVEKSNAE